MEFKVGDIVRVRGMDGPNMVVENEVDDSEELNVMFFSNGEWLEVGMKPAYLELVERPKAADAVSTPSKGKDAGVPTITVEINQEELNQLLLIAGRSNVGGHKADLWLDEAWKLMKEASK